MSFFIYSVLKHLTRFDNEIIRIQIKFPLNVSDAVIIEMRLRSVSAAAATDSGAAVATTAAAVSSVRDKA